MRQRRLCKRLHELQAQAPRRDQLLLKIGAAKKEPDAPFLWSRSVCLSPTRRSPPRPSPSRSIAKSCATHAAARHATCRAPISPTRTRAKLWTYYIQLTEVEQAFKELKGDLGIRPIDHQREDRIEAHIFVAFLADCLQVTLKARLRPGAGAHAPRRAGEPCRHSDGRRASADHRWTPLDPQSLHPTRARAADPARSAAPGAAATTTTEALRYRQEPPRPSPSVVPTFADVHTAGQ